MKFILDVNDYVQDWYPILLISLELMTLVLLISQAIPNIEIKGILYSKGYLLINISKVLHFYSS
jgi:hypothetical protein